MSFSFLTTFVYKKKLTNLRDKKKYFRQMFKIQNTFFTNPDNLVHREHSKVVFFILTTFVYKKKN